MLPEIVLSFFPFITLIFFWLSSSGTKDIKPISQQYILFFIVVMALFMGLFPVLEYSDKEKYLNFYRAVSSNSFSYQYKDTGWQLFVSFCAKFFGDRYELFFLLVSFIYSFSYFFFAVHHFGKKYAGFFIIMAFGCLGFIGYGTNTIRSGLALGLLLISLSFNGKLILKVFLALLSISFHISMGIPVLVFLIVKFLNKNWFAYLFWAFCFILSLLNFDLSPIVEEVMFLDDRVEQYSTMTSDSYASRYRIDFLIYSVIPIIIAGTYKRKGMKPSVFYDHLFRSYLILNALWLLVIRMAYTNRIAYFSWMLIPYVVLYPILYCEKSRQGDVFRIMALFMLVNVVL